MAVREELLFGGLAEPLVQDAELEVGHDDVLVVGGDELRGARAEHGGQAFHGEAVVQELGEGGGRGVGGEAQRGQQLVHRAGPQPQQQPRVLLLHLEGEQHGAQRVVHAHPVAVFPADEEAAVAARRLVRLELVRAPVAVRQHGVAQRVEGALVLGAVHPVAAAALLVAGAGGLALGRQHDHGEGRGPGQGLLQLPLRRRHRGGGGRGRGGGGGRA